MAHGNAGRGLLREQTSFEVMFRGEIEPLM